ncbi:hypothetical protein TREMEDRAFT_61446 [Tremella mesenterica DSM 1558]|uniref:uncharacterized protein n=1 Tax=Tremella mesenterica (strain ATCC 24925 / CBS 8224 / DSM 1558 / NBRC 9311 / NRRL Y-6157 / RJB 2259-6 / UBC 559-6) TaxID=578456 RepID=UPI0003F4A27F|nr:uncharacterized protein TREMEDRAFT_61446 [Tremella mesenterica DSM 1558]EIW70933.1 hypothetical protein TREMEDRAFT_61446 [Tremella mesenterica DSM 1558]
MLSLALLSLLSLPFSFGEPIPRSICVLDCQTTQVYPPRSIPTGLSPFRRTTYTDVLLVHGRPTHQVCLAAPLPPIAGTAVITTSCEETSGNDWLTWNLTSGASTISFEYEGVTWALQAASFDPNCLIEISPLSSSASQSWILTSDNRIQLEGQNLCILGDTTPILQDCTATDGVETWIPTTP